jgi:hypothetical protein
MIPESSDGPDRGAGEQPGASDDRGTLDPEEQSGEAGAEAAVIPEEGDEFDDATVIEEYVDPDVQSRLWLKAVVPLLQLRSHETDPNGRVQFAFDLMYIAACERIARILRSDVASEHE